MVQLRTRRVALVLYGVLLVLPTAVLGGLQWYEIVKSHQALLAAVPEKADDAARRLQEMAQERLARLLDSEEQRPITHYSSLHLQENSSEGSYSLLVSPLLRDNRPRGILAWFAFDLQPGDPREPDLFAGAQISPAALPADLQAVRQSAGHLREQLRREGSFGPLGRTLVTEECSAPIAALLAAQARGGDAECARRALTEHSARVLPLLITGMQLRFYREEASGSAGVPRAVAIRRVSMQPEPALRRDADPCVRALASGLDLVQGYFFDPDWLFRELPSQVARSVLDPTQRFVPAGAADSGERQPEYHAEIHLVQALSFESADEGDQDFAVVRVAADTGHLERSFRSQTGRFFGMAGMLLLSLGTGLVLLLRSVTRDLEQAQRTENFVAAVTHELRTPLAAIQLHGEMLLEGWATEAHVQREYYRRIVRETGRLATLVERVLEKARLASGSPRPKPVDLNRAVDELRAQLADARTAERDDLAFDLAPALPRAMANAEAVSSILVNLVENARKYAPVDFSRQNFEPIRVVTRASNGRVELEVMDRGPGIEPAERQRIFEAFYRIGNEGTRTARGTGLGLHLVALHAEAVGADVQVEPRNGGGTTFRVSFQRAREDPGTKS